MVIDTSVVMVALTEDDGLVFVSAVERAEALSISAVNAYETRLVLGGRRSQAAEVRTALVSRFADLVTRSRMMVTPFDADQALLAHDAYLRFGKGFHPAALNCTDCAAYALANLRGEPLLFKGEGFAQTDAEAALGPA
jgi:ribonuclease VapC